MCSAVVADPSYLRPFVFTCKLKRCDDPHDPKSNLNFYKKKKGHFSCKIYFKHQLLARVCLHTVKQCNLISGYQLPSR